MASRPKRPRWSNIGVKQRQELALRCFRRVGTISGAARESGISREAIMVWLREDPAFRKKFDECKLECQGQLEDATMEAALGEWDSEKGRYVKGDTMLKMFLLNSMDPAKYRRNIGVNGHLTVSDLVLGDEKPTEGKK